MGAEREHGMKVGAMLMVAGLLAACGHSDEEMAATRSELDAVQAQTSQEVARHEALQRELRARGLATSELPPEPPPESAPTEGNKK